MDCGLFGVRFLFLGHKNGAVAPVDHLSTFATAPFNVLRKGRIKVKVSITNRKTIKRRTAYVEAFR